MSSRSRIRALAWATSAMAVTIIFGCDESDPARKGHRGEVCQTTSDCAAPYACVPRPNAAGGLCAPSTFGISASQKECLLVDCIERSDCCVRNGEPASCTTEVCDDGMCRRYCRRDLDCPLRRNCINNVCKQCVSDSECGNDFVCVDFTCTFPCQSDAQCSGGKRCEGRRCVAFSCEADRECIALFRNVEAKCNDGDCVLGCESDAECGNPLEFNYFACVDRRCTKLGCETDTECELLQSPGQAQSGRKLVCHEPKATGADIPSPPP